MARTVQGVTLVPSPPPAEGRAQPIGEGPGRRFDTELGRVYVTHVDEESVIMYPIGYSFNPDDSPSAQWRDDYEADLCWKTCIIYEQINATHPRLVPFLRRDPWTALPVLAKPSGPPLVNFVRDHKSELYSAPLESAACRVVPRYRPLIYQWALHIMSGLVFIHSQDVVVGDLAEDHCWLSSPSLSLSLVGFPYAGFRSHDHGGRVYPGTYVSGDSFSTLFHGVRARRSDPTKQSDLFQWACLVFRLMTSFWPGSRMGLSESEVSQLVSRKQWPLLGAEYMGDVVRKCWNGDYGSAEEVKGAVIAFLQNQGWQIEGEDGLRGFNAAKLFED